MDSITKGKIKKGGGENRAGEKTYGMTFGIVFKKNLKERDLMTGKTMSLSEL